MIGLLLGWIHADAAWAACTRPLEVPPLPNGEIATAPQMKLAHDKVQDYVNLLQAYQTCLYQQIGMLPPGKNIEFSLAWRAQADAAIDAAHQIADAFSVQLKRFNAHRSMPQESSR